MSDDGSAGVEAPAGDPGSSEPEARGGTVRLGIVVAAVAVVGLALVFFSEDVPAPLGPGSAAPDFSLAQQGSQEIRSLRGEGGRVLLLNFWATWCKPCEEEMPAMERLYQELRDSEFELLAISVDDTSEQVTTFLAGRGLTFPVLLDPDEQVSRLYQTTGYPETLLIDRNGRIVERYVGPREWDDEIYVRRVRALLDAG